MGWLLAPTLAGADPPAATAPSEPHREEALRSFRSFAAGWMDKLERDEDRARDRALAAPGAAARETGASQSSARSYRGVGDSVDVELRPTGNAHTPFVGVLRYAELAYRCAGAVQASCAVFSRRVVSEVFRFQNGRWIY